MLRRSFFSFLPVGLASLFIKNEVKASKEKVQIAKRGNLEYHIVNGNVIFENNGIHQYWYNAKGQLHRTDGPASISHGDRCQQWWVNGKRHREDGPAVIHKGFAEEWWVNGKLHRDDGPAMEWYNGTKNWYQHGLLHRANGPAIELSDGTKKWYLNGKCQKTIWPDGTEVNERTQNASS